MLNNEEVELINKSIGEFINELKDKKINLWVEGESLRYKAPVGVVTKEILKSIGDRKAEVIDYLKIKNLGGIFYAPINKVEEKEYYPLSAAQLRMFFLSQLDSDSTAYNLTQALKIHGEFDLEQLREVLNQLVTRHEALRTSFLIVEENPVQMIHDTVDFNVDFQETENTKESIDHIIKDFIKPYDLAKTPLFRFKLVRLVNSDNKPSYILIQDMHHIISDGVSEALLVHEVNELFSGKCLPNLKIQYKDYADWHQKLLSSNEIQRQRQYWLEKLKSDIPLLNLPTDYARPQAFSFKGNSIKFKIEKPMADKLYNLARENRVTLFTLLLASYSILLSRYTGQNDIIIGTPTAGRRHADVNNTMGVFVNTLALRISYTPECEFDEFLRSLGHEVVQDFDNQDYPFEYFLEDLMITRDLSRNPIFDTMFILQNMNTDEIKVDELEISDYDFDKGMAQVDISLIGIQKKDGIDIEINYCTSLFKEETINKFGEHLINILKYLTEYPKARLHNIDILSDVEKSQLLYEFNNTAVQYLKDKTVHELIEEQVKRTPESVALVLWDMQLTYREFNSMANCVAKSIREKGVERDGIVAIIVNRSFEMLIGILGILKSGGAYLPIDPEYPEDRINYMLEDSGANILLTMSDLNHKTLFKGETILLDKVDFSKSFEDDLTVINSPQDLAYVIYTSGSTGKPKGVMLEHRTVANFITGMTEKIYFSPTSTILALTTISFDIFVLETLLPLTQGSKIVIADEIQQRDPNMLSKLITESDIDMLQATPSRMQMILSIEKNHSCLRNLKYIMIGGEAFPPALLQVLKRVTNARIFNMYGPTETTVWSTVQDLTDCEVINIGKPIANTRIYIVDKFNNLQPIGVAGELCIAGDGMARGYLGRPELTEEKFTENPYSSGEKMYKTGDSARWLQNGEIDCLGRIDSQVKIRGYRIELGEIESQLLKYEGTKEVVVVVKEDKEMNKYLCAYLVLDMELDISSIKEYLKKVLPDYMIPSYFIQLPKLPQTPNGKIDRKSLPEPKGNSTREVEYVAPRNEVEMKLQKIWQEVLGIESVGINDNFFSLGGHSLKAIILTSKIYKELEVQVQVAEIFKRQTLLELAEYIMSVGKCIFSTIEKAATKENYISTPAQKRLHALSYIGEPNTVYNIPLFMYFNGELNVKKVEDIFKIIVNRHETFRTSFEFINAESMQKIHDKVDFGVDYEEEYDVNIYTAITKFIKPFDLSKAPLLRVKVIKCNTEKYLIMIDMHHIISDGTSLHILETEFINLYKGFILPEIKIQYRDFSEWQYKFLHSEEIKKQEKYWTDVFQGEIPILDMPTDYPRDFERNFEGNSMKYEIDSDLTKEIYKLTLETGTTLFMVLFAAYNILLHKYTAQEDILVGSSIAGRDHVDLENMIGMLVNTTAIRNFPKSEKTFDEFLKEVKESSLGALEHQDYPFDHLIETLNIKSHPGRNILFDTMFILQNMDNPNENAQKELFDFIESTNSISKFDLTLEAIEVDDKISITIEYKTKLFSRDTINKFGEHFINILKYSTKHPKARLHEIDMLSDVEKSQLLYEFNNTAVQYPKDKTVHELIEEQVKRTPESVALVLGDKRLTYKEFNSMANCVSKRLRVKGVERDSIVAISVNRSFEMLIGILGILKSGGAYLPIDPEYPEDRINYMLEDSGANILLTMSDLNHKTLFKGETILLDKVDFSQSFEDDLTVINSPQDLAYVIYTSGSTGKPKGVMLEHRTVVNFITGMTEKVYFSPTSTILALTTISFDIFVLETLLPLTQGSKIVIADEIQQRDPNMLSKLITESDIDMLQATPSRMQMILSIEKNHSCLRNLKYIMIGGEAFPPSLLQVLKRVTNARIFNMYGPTETTVWSTVQDLTDCEVINIGKPIANTSIYIVDKFNNLQPIGVAGELCIAGDGMARGYLGRPELTKEKFTENPYSSGERMYKTGDSARWLQNGEIDCLGRLDSQVKIRGYRIELGEIESQLLKHSQIKDAVVVDKTDSSGNKYLCAYIVGENELAISELREYISEELPYYMVPSYFVQLEKIPLTDNGKVNRVMLLNLPIEIPNVKKYKEYVEPRNEIEKKLVEVWKEVLCIDYEIGIYDNFFELGGTSLNAIQVIGKLEGFSVNMGHIMKYATIAELSKYAVIEVSNNIDLPNVMKENLDIEYDYFKNGTLEPITELLDCNTRMLYFILKKKVKNFQNYIHILFNGFVFYIIQNEDGTIYNIDCTTYPIREDIFILNTYKSKGIQAMEEIENLLDKGELVIIDAFKSRLPFHKDFISKEYICELEPLMMGHTFLAIAHDKDNLYYVEMIGEINRKNHIPYSGNKSVGIINKKDLLPAFEVYAYFGVIDIDYLNLGKKSQLKEDIEKISFEYNTQEITYQDGRNIFYGINAIDLLIDLCKKEELDLNGIRNLKELISWKFWLTAVRRKLLKHVLETYSERCNIEIKDELIVLLGDLHTEWRHIQSVIDGRVKENYFILGSEYIPYFESLKGNELMLIDKLNRLWK